MRFLGIGEYCDLGAMYMRMVETGHEVKVFVENPDYQDIYRGMLTFTDDWHDELDWIREAGRDGVILFESAIKGLIQDKLRHDGFQVIGGSAFGDRLESDRSFGQQMMQQMGMSIAQTFAFTSYVAAIQLIKACKKRYVYKNNGADSLRTRNYIGTLEDGSDLIALLELYANQHIASEVVVSPNFVLMDYIEGIEIGVGAYFNGDHFLYPACLDWEHKRFFPGNLGELTGEMGTIVTYLGAEVIFQKTLLQLEAKLAKNGHCGYINLNMIVNQQGLWPLEFTSRFGYPGYSICTNLHKESWPSIFKKMLDKSTLEIETHAGFAAGIVLNVPPFPYSYGYKQLSKGMPIMFKPNMSSHDMQRLHFNEVEKVAEQLYTSGMTGCVATAVGIGNSIFDARKQAYDLAVKVILPNIRYRQDIGQNLLNGEFQQLVDWGYISAKDMEI